MKALLTSTLAHAPKAIQCPFLSRMLKSRRITALQLENKINQNMDHCPFLRMVKKIEDIPANDYNTEEVDIQSEEPEVDPIASSPPPFLGSAQIAEKLG